jgi:hypothetical protein
MLPNAMGQFIDAAQRLVAYHSCRIEKLLPIVMVGENVTIFAKVFW